MARAIWKDTIIAESEGTQKVDGYVYFPPDSIKREYLQDSPKHSSCAWKGTADYFDLTVDGEVNPNAAWTYLTPLPAARGITGWIGFWHGVKVET